MSLSDSQISRLTVLSDDSTIQDVAALLRDSYRHRAYFIALSMSHGLALTLLATLYGLDETELPLEPYLPNLSIGFDSFKVRLIEALRYHL